MGEVGRWDGRLFERFRAARTGGAHHRRLLAELVRIHEPLVMTLVAQLRGQAPKEQHARRMFSFMRVRGAERLEWPEALNVGRFGLKKALEQFDPTRSGFTQYLRRKIYYELQCEVTRSSIVLVPRERRREPDIEYVEHDEQAGLFDARIHEDRELALVEMLDLERERPAPPDLRSALAIFLEDHCRFAPGARAAATALAGRLANVARARGEDAPRNALREEFRARGVRRTTLRVPWCPAAEGFAGVALRPTPQSRPRPLQSRPADPGPCLASGHGG